MCELVKVLQSEVAVSEYTPQPQHTHTPHTHTHTHTCFPLLPPLINQNVHLCRSSTPTFRYAYTAYILSNLCTIREGRDVLLDEDRGVVPAITPYLHSPNIIHRLGAARTLKVRLPHWSQCAVVHIGALTIQDM